MDNPVIAALIGAVVGSLLTFISTYVVMRWQSSDARRLAREQDLRNIIAGMLPLVAHIFVLGKLEVLDPREVTEIEEEWAIVSRQLQLRSAMLPKKAVQSADLIVANVTEYLQMVNTFTRGNLSKDELQRGRHGLMKNLQRHIADYENEILSDT